MDFLAFVEPTGLFASWFVFSCVRLVRLRKKMHSGIYKVLILIFLPTSLIQLYCLQLFPSFICSFQKACAAQMLLLLLLPVGERDGFNISKVPHRKKAPHYLKCQHQTTAHL